MWCGVVGWLVGWLLGYWEILILICCPEVEVEGVYDVSEVIYIHMYIYNLYIPAHPPHRTFYLHIHAINLPSALPMAMAISSRKSRQSSGPTDIHSSRQSINHPIRSQTKNRVCSTWIHLHLPFANLKYLSFNVLLCPEFVDTYIYIGVM